jgi:hypothetical protein
MDNSRIPHGNRSLVTLVATFVVALALLAISVHWHAEEFWLKCAEAVGEALLVAVLIDVLFRRTLDRVRAMDRASEDAVREDIARVHKTADIFEKARLDLEAGQRQIQMDDIVDRLRRIEDAVDATKK